MRGVQRSKSMREAAVNDNEGFGLGLIVLILLIVFFMVMISAFIKGEMPKLSVKCNNCIEKIKND